MQNSLPQTHLAHEEFIRQSIEIAAGARSKGNHPFGSLLVDEDGRIMLTGENAVVTEGDITGHAEINLIREASKTFSREALSKATLYASTEPCMMCCGAIHWAGIPRVVFGCSSATLGKIVGSSDFQVPCREVFSRSAQPVVEVVGPVLEEEAVAVHKGYW